MRTLFLLFALLPLIATAALDREEQSRLDELDSPEGHASPFETIVITADRKARDAAATPASISSVGAEEIADLSAKHQDEILNRIAGVYVQHGSGQESLGAIRSPVRGPAARSSSRKTRCPSARPASAISMRCSSSTTNRLRRSKCCAARAR